MFPFPDDAIALARLNWCRSGSPNETEGLSCILRSRMCNSHVNSLENEAWKRSSEPTLNGLLKAAQVESWNAGSRPSVQGVCGLHMADRFGETLWQSLGYEREKAAYDSIISTKAKQAYLQ